MCYYITHGDIMYVRYMLEEKLTRIQTEYEIFKNSNYTLSDVEIAYEMSVRGIPTSSSTVGRDLTSILFKRIISIEEFNLVQEKREENKKRGNIKGGRNFYYNNISIKDSNGKFNGSRKRTK